MCGWKRAHTGSITRLRLTALYQTAAAALIVVSDGKGVATESERRYTVTKGNGILITGGMTVGIKADSIEPAELIYIKIGGDSVKQLISLIEKQRAGNIA